MPEKRRFRFKIIQTEEKEYHMFFDHIEDTYTVYKIIMDKFPELENTGDFNIVGGLMSNLWMRDKAVDFWSENFHKYVHELEETSQKNLVFEIVIDKNKELIVSPHYKGN